MSNKTDLDWLARNVHVWREGKHEVLVSWPRNVGTLTWSSVSSNAGWITKEQWLSSRAELQNKPRFSDHHDAKCFVQNDSGTWFKNRNSTNVIPESNGGWFDRDMSCGWTQLGAGEVLGDWRDTMERRPADLSSAAVIKRLDEATQNVLAAVPALMDEKYSFEPEFMPVSVSNETVQLERPVAVAGTGNGSAAESAFLIGRVIDLLRTSVDHFSANELAELHQLCDAELTKRDAAVCGGQKYLDAQWFERGELPPVGMAVQLWHGGTYAYDCELIAKRGNNFVLWNLTWDRSDSADCMMCEFKPIPTERDVLIEIIKKTDDTDDKIADAILAAGFKRGAA